MNLQQRKQRSQERKDAKNLEPIFNIDQTTKDKYYYKIICPFCKKEKIVNRELLLKEFKCSDCKCLDTIERKTGYRGVLKNPKNMKKLENGCYEKLGCKRPFCSKDVQRKVSDTLKDENTGKRKLMGFTDINVMQKKYGINNAMDSMFFREKIMKTLSKRANNYYNKTIDESFDFSKMNNLEFKFYNYIKDKNLQFANRRALRYLEIDFYNEKEKIGYEVCGDYWHTVEQKGKGYHLRKYSLACSKKIRLFQFFEDEIHKLESTIISYITEDFKRDFNMEKGDKSEFNFFNISFYNSNYFDFFKIKDSKGGRYISALCKEGLIIFPTNERGSLICAYKEMNKKYNIILDNRLCPVLEENKKTKVNLIEKKCGFTEDAGMKIFNRGFYEN